jgi:hypothetical protein
VAAGAVRALSSAERRLPLTGGIMRKMMLALGATAMLSLGAFGCATAHEARADYHRERADAAAEHGHFIKAAKEEHKANVEEHRAETAPLP